MKREDIAIIISLIAIGMSGYRFYQENFAESQVSIVDFPANDSYIWTQGSCRQPIDFKFYLNNPGPKMVFITGIYVANVTDEGYHIFFLVKEDNYYNAVYPTIIPQTPFTIEPGKAELISISIPALDPGIKTDIQIKVFYETPINLLESDIVSIKWVC